MRYSVLAKCLGFLAIPLWMREPALACKCVEASVCGQFAYADVIFAGRVQSVEPNFDPWDPEFTKRLADLFPGRDLDDVDLDKDLTPDALQKLKDLYSSMFPEPTRSQILKARNLDEVESDTAKVLEDGKRFTLSVSHGYKGVSATQRTIDVWTDFSDCSLALAKGETYLVYASRDKSGRYFADRCSGTQRLTDAGPDLAYLFFRENGVGIDGRIYGFLTADERDLVLPRIGDMVRAPQSNMPIELSESTSGLRWFSVTNAQGGFAFDGLASGQYDLSVLDPKTLEPRKEIQNRRVQIQKSECKAEFLYVPNH